MMVSSYTPGSRPLTLGQSMTFEDLLSEISRHHRILFPVWKSEVDRCNDLGLLAFLPAGYANAATFEEAEYDFWTLEYTQVYIEVVEGEVFGDLQQMIGGFEGTEDFLVMVAGSPGDAESPSFALQRIGPDTDESSRGGSHRFMRN